MFRNLTPTVKNLLILNVGIYAIGAFMSVDFVQLLGLRYIFAENFEPYQILTHMFVHASIGHLFGNMFALFIFGPLLEQFWGSQRFLVFYLVCGLGASVLYSGIDYAEKRGLQKDMEAYMANPDPDRFNSFISEHGTLGYKTFQMEEFADAYRDRPESTTYAQQSTEYVGNIAGFKLNIPMVGASGAVFAILMAFGMLFPNTELFLLFLPIPIKAKYFVTFYGLYELYAGFMRVPGDNIAHFAHLGGMLFAFILVRLWRNNRNSFY